MLRILPDSILSLVYPQECGVCQGEVESPNDGIACSGCWTKTRIFDGTETLCNKCGAFLFGAGAAREGLRCRKCEEHHYERAFAVGIYEHALSSSVLHLKRTPHIPGRLKTLLGNTFDRFQANSDITIVPVPLSSRRRSERGFNQAGIIANIIAKHVGIVPDENSFVRKLHTPMHRAGMDRKARASTVKDAFEIVRPKLIENRNVLLVDDVFTSGETASICSRVLKKSGAATVNVLTIARAA
jgi:ComF family protein